MAMLRDVMDSQSARDFDGAVAAPVVNDQGLDDIYAGQRAGQIGNGCRQGLFLIETRDLDDELHKAVLSRRRVESGL
jgi:hypothetical protein